MNSFDWSEHSIRQVNQLKNNNKKFKNCKLWMRNAFIRAWGASLYSRQSNAALLMVQQDGVWKAVTKQYKLDQNDILRIACKDVDKVDKSAILSTIATECDIQKSDHLKDAQLDYWLDVIVDEVAKACQSQYEKDTLEVRENLLHIASLCVLAIQTMDLHPWKNDVSDL